MRTRTPNVHYVHSTEEGLTHGRRSTYVNYKCRCEPCTEANREYGRGAQSRYRKGKAK